MASPAASSSAKERGLRVFVVENHEDTRLALTLLLDQLGHEVDGAPNLAEALDALANAAPDVIISDIGLPDGSGWDLLKQLRHVPYAIAMSGYGMNADRERSRAAGFRHHLVKPMDLEQLEAMLAEAARERAASTSSN